VQITRQCPGRPCRTYAEKSEPKVSGRGCGRALLPAPIQASHGPTPAALTRARTSPASGIGRGTSSSRSMTARGAEAVDASAVIIAPDLGIDLSLKVTPSSAMKIASRTAGAVAWHSPRRSFASPIDPRRPALGHFLATQSGRAPAFRRMAWRPLQLMPKSDGGGKALSILPWRNS
jgi:hypothetical protein